MKTTNIIAISLVAFVSACGPIGGHRNSTKEAWNAANDPLLLGGNFERSFAQLPRHGQLKSIPWTDSYWPSHLGGISQRWRTDLSAADQFTYVPPTKKQLLDMTAAQISDLSPAEKYDILMSRYDYPSVERERLRVSPSNATWEGMCHGWAAAALNFKEPKPIAMTNEDGVVIPFASSDIKALLSYYQGDVSYAPSNLLGTRCDVDLIKNPGAIRYHPECRGINAGSLHVAIANLIGRDKQGLVADISHGNEVWNQPVFAYSTEVIRTQDPSPGASTNAATELVVKTNISYALEVEPQWHTLNGTDGWSGMAASYEYQLELDRDGAIVGGAWISDYVPDFIWIQSTPRFEGYYKAVKTLYDKAISAAPLRDPRET